MVLPTGQKNATDSKSQFMGNYKEKLMDYVTDAIGNKYECEIVLNKHVISADGFDRMIKFIKKHYTLEENIHRESLDIRVDKSDFRVTITGKDNIHEYCKTNSIPHSDVTVIHKKRVKEYPSIDINEYDIRLNINSESSPQDEVKMEFVGGIRKKDKYYRYKKRYSFINDQKTLRVDMSIVRSSFYKNSKNLIRSKTLSNVEEFEVEIEVLPNNRKDVEAIVLSMIDVTEQLLKANRNVKVLMSKKEEEDLLKEYGRLVDPNIDEEYMLSNKTQHFLRYQPITLMRRNLLEPDVDVVSIQKDYSCTEKADGERYLMFISKNGDVYFMNSRLNLYATGLRHSSMKSCLVDGEYITKGKLNTKLDMFMCFDCYTFQGKDIRNKSLPDRLDVIRKILHEWETKEPLIQLKEFFYGSESIVLDTKKCLEKNSTLPYHTDGLIFTPLYLSPGALYKNDITMKSFGGTWNRVFKWKPPEENTIDVLVKFGEECIVENEQGVQQKSIYVDMFVAYRGSVESTINVLDMYNDINTNKTKKDMNKVINRLYDFTYLPLEGTNKHPLTTFTKEPITNDVIVEMAYSPNAKYMKWSPLRLREDKTAVMRKTNSIENAANYYNTAMNVWMSIIDPVTTQMLKGEVQLETDTVKTDQQDLYYARETPRNRIMIRPMLDFHNMWIKKKNLYDLFGGKSFRLLEIGCGQAGDLPKWIDNKFTQIVGVDNNEDNLLNSNHGAYKRVIENDKFDMKKQSFMFLLLDGGVKWNTNIVDTIQSEEFTYLTKVAMGMIDKAKIKNPMLEKNLNCLNEPFDLVSCQFAIHYFFQSIDTLEAFCYNVDKHLKVGGYFMGTCLDGHLVNNAFKKEKSSILKGVMNEKVLWQIEKKYDGFESDSVESENLGKQIDVYVESINKIIPEYLVDFELLKRKLAKYNIEPVDPQTDKTISLKTKESSGSFELLWKTMIQANKKGYKHWSVTNAIENMTDQMKEFSFLNRWFIFKKIAK